MPELPEVETIARALRNGGRGRESILGRTIIGVLLRWERSLAMPTPAELPGRLIGQRIERVGRRAKYLQIGLTRDTLLVHLRMSGDLLVEPSEMELPEHHRLVLDLDNGTRLAFNDTRKFGRVWLTGEPEAVLAGLGPEPLEDDFTAQVLGERLKQHKRQIKALLLDQSFLAGMGNIYTDEALHRARLHPLRRANSLSEAEVLRLWQAIRAVLEAGIDQKGASIDWVYRGGDFQNSFHVYQRAGQPCPQCGEPVVRIVVAQRGTHFCPACQQEQDLQD